LKPDKGSVAFEGGTDFEKALLEAQSEASLDGILVASAEGRILSFNSRFAEMWNFPEELLDRRDADRARAHVMNQLLDPAGFMERVRHVYENPTESTQDELRLRDGRIFERYSRPILRPDTGTFGRVWFFRDVTRARRASARLHAQYEVTKVMAESATLERGAEAMLRGIGTSLGWELVALWLVDEEDERLSCLALWHTPALSAQDFAETSRRMKFAKGEGLPGAGWDAAQPVWIRDVAIETRFARSRLAAELGLHSALAFPITIGDEIVGVVEAFTRETRDPDDELMEAKAALGRQVGQFIARRRIEEAVRVSEARKTAILESALDCIITMDHRGNIVDFNPAAEQAFGYRHQDVVGKEMASLIIPEPLREKHRAGLRKYLETGEGPLLGKRIEVHGQRADGSIFPIELAISVVDNSGPQLFTGYLRDISERRTAEQERAKLLEAEREARAEAERAQKRLAYLAEASRVLSSSLDYRTTLTKIADLAVPQLADWCAVYIAGQSGAPRPLAVAHVDPDKVRLAQKYYMSYPPDPNSTSGTPNVIRTGRSELVPQLPPGLLEEAITDPEQLKIVKELTIESYMIVPLKARNRILGALTFVSSDPNRRFDPHDLSFAEDVAQRAALAIDNARLYEEQAGVARALQRSLLPPSLPTMPGVELATLYEPSIEGNEVGGDFYDVFPLGGNEWAIVIGDVCGKGAEAAAITGLARHTIRAVGMRESDPKTLLETLNEAMLRQPSGERFATVALARLRVHEDGAEIEVACAGHPEPLLLRENGEVERLGEAGTVLGLFTGIDINPRATTLGAGDAVVFYTDGLTEARSETRIYGQYRLTRALAECSGCDAQGMVDHVRSSVEDFRARKARDDMAMVVIRMTGAS
jgi:PAS domain S-box-containing protein